MFPSRLLSRSASSATLVSLFSLRRSSVACDGGSFSLAVAVNVIASIPNVVDPIEFLRKQAGEVISVAVGLACPCLKSFDNTIRGIKSQREAASPDTFIFEHVSKFVTKFVYSIADVF